MPVRITAGHRRKFHAHAAENEFPVHERNERVLKRQFFGIFGKIPLPVLFSADKKSHFRNFAVAFFHSHGNIFFAFPHKRNRRIISVEAVYAVHFFHSRVFDFFFFLKTPVSVFRRNGRYGFIKHTSLLVVFFLFQPEPL